jgi:signal transduction histidine kinase
MTRHNCGHAEKQCPISKTPCPGVCIYSHILKNINVGIIVLDYEARTVLFQNKAARDILDSVNKSDDYQSLTDFLLPDFTKRLLAKEFEKPETVHCGNSIIGFTVYHIGAKHLWIFLRDITESKRLESIAEAVNTMENIGYIFSGIRHELGNPVNSLKMTLTVLKRNLNTYSKQMVEDYVDRSLKEISRVEYLLKSLKNFSMYESPDLRDTDIDGFIEDFLPLARGELQHRGITIKTDFHREKKWARIDTRALHQVLLNLLSNAADALEGEEAPEIVITTAKTSNLVQILVADNGPGMSEEQRKNVFKPFYTSKQNGTGLGLVIAKKMLAKMNGSIEVESRENLGTRVLLCLPEGKGDDSPSEHRVPEMT